MEVFRVITTILPTKGRSVLIGVLVISGLGLIHFTALGYFASELVFGASDPKKVEISQESRANPEQFNKYCSPCHPGGGNKYKLHLPLKRAPQLAEFETFLAYIRAPKARDGSSTRMMQFPARILSEQEAREIYQYIDQVLRED